MYRTRWLIARSFEIGLTLSSHPVPREGKSFFGTVASSPSGARAVTDRLLGCVGTVRIDTNYTKASWTHTST